MSDTIERHRVRVWFGHTAIADYSGDTEQAECYARAMDRRFPGLTITNEIVPLNGDRNTLDM